MKNRYQAALTASLVLASALTLNAAGFFFKDGDKVVMMGDSITEQYLYSRYVEAWTLTRFPAWNITFVNVGISGDRSTGGNKRFTRDVTSNSPTAMTVDFGMNDGGYAPFEETGFKNYMGGLQGIADQAKAANVRVAWCTPSPKEDPGSGPAIKGYNETLEKYSAGVKQIAATNGNALFVDQLHPYMAAMDKARAVDPKNLIGGGDAVHPGPPGQALMASAILKGMNFPSLVASAEINAASGKVIKTQNCKIDGVKVAADGKIEFKQLDAALPFFPAEAKPILQWAPILDELNDYRLKVTGLKPGQYEIRLGGIKVAEHSNTELNTGVNLAAAVLTTGPIADQVKTFSNALQAKDNYYHGQIFRGVLIADINIPDFLDIKKEYIETKRDATFKERLAKMPQYFDAIRKTLVMQPHQVEIVAIPKP